MPDAGRRRASWPALMVRLGRDHDIDDARAAARPWTSRSGAPSATRWRSTEAVDDAARRRARPTSRELCVHAGRGAGGRPSRRAPGAGLGRGVRALPALGAPPRAATPTRRCRGRRWWSRCRAALRRRPALPRPRRRRAGDAAGRRPRRQGRRRSTTRSASSCTARRGDRVEARRAAGDRARPRRGRPGCAWPPASRSATTPAERGAAAAGGRRCLSCPRSRPCAAGWCRC